MERYQSYQLHFTDEKTEIEQGWGSFPKSHRELPFKGVLIPSIWFQPLLCTLPWSMISHNTSERARYTGEVNKHVIHN